MQVIVEDGEAARREAGGVAIAVEKGGVRGPGGGVGCGGMASSPTAITDMSTYPWRWNREPWGSV